MVSVSIATWPCSMARTINAPDCYRARWVLRQRAGLYPLNKGRLLIDNKEIKDVRLDLVFVSQEVDLYHSFGIDLDNLDEAMSKADYGIDVSSGVETNGIKDRNKIIEIVRRTKNGNR